MMPPVVRSVAVPSGAVFDHGRRSSSAMWTGDKRRRTIGGPSPRPLGLGSSSSDDTTDAMLMDDDSDTRPQVDLQEEQQEEREEDLVFSAEDDIDKEELSRCWKLLLSRERPVYYRVGRALSSNDATELYQRLLALRFRDYKKLKEGSLNWDDTASAVPATAIEYPDEVFDWDDPFEPGPSIFGWTYDTQYFDLTELDDYQRIVPTRADVDEYYDWEKYRLIFSCYETDEAYVKYWDQLTKKMKWVDDALLLGHKEFSMRYDDRGGRQAVKIAAGLCHLPASLATRGYEEYVLARQYDLDCRKGYDLVYFEVWKRISKQEMSFREALKDILSSENKLSSSCLFRIQAEIKGCGLMRRNYSICMDDIQKLVVKGGEGAVSKKHFTDAVYSKIPIPKLYVDYAKKKLEVARRIHLMPGTGSQAALYNVTTSIYWIPKAFITDNDPLQAWACHGGLKTVNLTVRMGQSIKYRVGAFTHNASIIYGT